MLSSRRDLFGGEIFSAWLMTIAVSHNVLWAVGRQCCFGKKIWVNGELLCDRFPRLFSFALEEDSSVANMASALDLSSHFALLLSAEAFQELQLVSQVLLDTPIDDGVPDQRPFTWGPSYTPSKFYNFLFGQLPTNMALNAIWKSKALPKQKVFVWLLMKDRLNTRDLMLRKHWHLDSEPHCVMCVSQVLETRDHLFFDCTSAKLCRDILDIHWDMALPLSEWYVAAKQAFIGPCFMQVVACAAWNIWKERNDLIFQNLPSSVSRWRVRFQHDLMLHRFEIKAALVQPLIDWLLNIFV
jgi:hypothetical protein